MYQLTGLIKVIKDTEEINDRFKKREFVVTDSSGQYPQDILFQLTQDRVTSIDPFKEGDQVSVNFFLRGREWTNKEGKVLYFNSLDVWKVESAIDPSGPPPMEEPPVEVVSSDDESDDLPF